MRTLFGNFNNDNHDINDDDHEHSENISYIEIFFIGASVALILSIIFFTTANSQTITGTVTDEITKEALIGVNIILNDGGGTSTDIDGKYQLKLQERKITG